jgi:Protein of unknown function (DUF2971)
MEIVTAGSHRIERLYHYQRFKHDWLEELLKTKTIFFSDPSSFNDPWDCKPYFDVTRLSDPAVYEQHVQWSIRAMKDGDTDISEEELRRRATRLRLDRPFLEEQIREIGQTLHEPIARQYRVYCLTTIPTSTLMWSHYAQNHTGICLGFRCRNHVFCGALRVEYLDTFPLMDMADDSQEASLLPFRAKSSVWSYEDEYRLIAQEEAEGDGNDTLITRNNMLRVPEDALACVIVGCQMKEPERQVVRRLIEEYAQGVHLQQAVRVPNHYQLTLETLV